MRLLLAVLMCYLSLSKATVHPYNPVFEYDVPVAQQQVYVPVAHQQVYRTVHGNGAPIYTNGYNSAYSNYGYAYGGYAPVSHSYQQTRTYPVSYYRPVSFLIVNFLANSSFLENLSRAI